jgi:hypothetical protein
MLGLITPRIALYAAAVAIGIAVGWQINGWRLEARIAFIEATYAKAFADAKEKSLAQQASLQATADKLRKDHNEKLSSVQRSLDIAINSLRNRPSLSEQRNSSGTGNGQTSPGCTGAELYRETAEDLVREAARADKVREGLSMCYQQYDAVRDTLNKQKGK